MPPNTAALTKAKTKSLSKSTASFITCQNAPPSRPITRVASNQLAQIAKVQKNAVSSGTQRIAAQKRGATAFATGSIAISPSAVIWSVARISPSSAAIDEPARPMNSSAVSTGASSRYRPSPTSALIWLEAPYVSSAR